MNNDCVQVSPFLIRCWEDECVAYDLRSGDTHLISVVAGQVLLSCPEAGVDFDSLVRNTAAALRVKPDAEFSAHLHETLAALEGKGLLNRLAALPAKT